MGSFRSVAIISSLNVLFALLCWSYLPAPLALVYLLSNAFALLGALVTETRAEPGESEPSR